MKNKIALIGDLILDKFINYKSLRLSPEGPAPIVKEIDSFEAPGGAANVAESLLNLGLKFSFYYPYSKKTDPIVDSLIKKILLNLEIYTEKILTEIKDINPLKIRHYVDDRQFMRSDTEGSDLNKISVITKDLIDIIVKKNDYFLVSDYQKGCFNTETLQYLIKTCNKLKKPLFIDTKNHNHKAIKNSFCLKINKKEFNILFSNYELRENYSLEQIKNNVKQVQNFYKIKNLVVTLGSEGCLASTESDSIYCPAYKVDVVDITGAGDAFLSALIYSFLKNNSQFKGDFFDNSLNIENIKFANYAAASVVAKKGTVPIDPNLIKNYITKSKEEKIVGFTNGCFDLFHIGHLHLIKEAKKYCNYLIIGLNSDESIKRIKGNKRPINNLQFRLKLLESLKFVDKVVVFSEDNPEKLIKQIKPNVLIKGDDYKEEEIIGASFVKSYGGKIIRVKFKDDTSSSKIINKIKGL